MVFGHKKMMIIIMIRELIWAARAGDRQRLATGWLLAAGQLLAAGKLLATKELGPWIPRFFFVFPGHGPGSLQSVR